MITERQQKILNLLVKEYLDRAEPISSQLLKKKSGLDISPATIRNDLQELTNLGYIAQPHTSAGRVPTEKGYRYFIEITFSGNIEEFPEFIVKEVENTKEKIEKELQLARKLAECLEELSSMLNLSHRIEEENLFDVLRLVGPSRTTHKKNIDLMRELLEELENF